MDGLIDCQGNSYKPFPKLAEGINIDFYRVDI